MAVPRARAILAFTSAVAGEDRDHERQHPHQVGGVAAQPLALGQRLVDEGDLALLEVAEAAVDQLGALRRRARGEVAAFDERGAQAPAGGVEGHAGAGDAAAHDQHVEVSSARRRSMAPRSKGTGGGTRVILGSASADRSRFLVDNRC